jgi:hypothetical protein
MKKVFILICIVLLVVSCKKTKIEPRGPTDVRIYNKTSELFENVVVKTSDDPFYVEREHNYGTVTSGAYTEYHRFDIAYREEADITLTIGGVEYSTPATDFTYLTYVGQDRITYEITIVDAVNHVLRVNTIIVEPIDDL